MERVQNVKHGMGNPGHLRESATKDNYRHDDNPDSRSQSRKRGVTFEFMSYQFQHFGTAN